MHLATGAEADHAAFAAFGLPDFMRAMLARRRSRTGSRGTVWPAAIWASLRSRESVSHVGGWVLAWASMVR